MSLQILLTYENYESRLKKEYNTLTMKIDDVKFRSIYCMCDKTSDVEKCVQKIDDVLQSDAENIPHDPKFENIIDSIGGICYYITLDLSSPQHSFSESIRFENDLAKARGLYYFYHGTQTEIAYQKISDHTLTINPKIHSCGYKISHFYPYILLVIGTMFIMYIVHIVKQKLSFSSNYLNVDIVKYYSDMLKMTLFYNLLWININEHGYAYAFQNLIYWSPLICYQIMNYIDKKDKIINNTREQLFNSVLNSLLSRSKLNNDPVESQKTELKTE